VRYSTLVVSLLDFRTGLEESLKAALHIFSHEVNMLLGH